MDSLGSEVRQWVEDAIGRGVTVADAEVLKAKETQSTWLLRLNERGRITCVVLKVSPLGWEGGVRDEATALQLLETLGIPAPRLLGFDVAGRTGSLLLLQTFLPGNSRPETKSPLDRMRAFGAVAAQLHGAGLPADHGLSHIDRPVWHDHYIDERREGRAPTTPLLQTADRVWATFQLADDSGVLVHGDFHHGNALWKGNAVIALIDWDGAGVGHPGIDLGWARLEATFAYSTAAADEIARGWTDSLGCPPENLAYWDLVAALQNPAHIGDRTHGRDEFLRNALKRIGAH